MARQMKTHCESIEEMMDNVLKAFEEYPKEKITGIWACYFNNLRGITSVDGGNVMTTSKLITTPEISLKPLALPSILG